MKMSVNWSLELTKLVVMHSEAIFNMFGPLMKDWVGSNV